MSEVRNNIELNGLTIETNEVTVAELLAEHGVDADKPGVAVAINDRIVRRTEWHSVSVRAGDRVEIITAMAGG